MKRLLLNKIGVFLLAIFAFTACNIKEDMSDCPGYLILDYTAYSDEILDAIDDESIVNIYIFDANDCCCDIISQKYEHLKENGYQLTIPIGYRGNDIVVWHGDSDVDYDNETMKIGTSQEDFILELDHLTNYTLEHKPSQLWASRLEPIEFCAAITRHRVHMIRLSTDINVSLYNVDASGDSTKVDMSNYLVSVETRNGTYQTDCDFCTGCQVIEYNNEYQIIHTPEFYTARVGTLRIGADRRCVLKIINRETGEAVSVSGSKEIDLLKYMLESNSVSGQDAQRFLDLNKIWSLSFVLDKYYAVTSMTINGWTVWFDDADLQ